MNWVQLVQQGYPFRVPFSLAQAEALDRFLAGRRLGRQGRRTLHRAEAALAEDDRRRRRDMKRLDQQYQDGTLGDRDLSFPVGDGGVAGAAVVARRPRVPAARTSAGGGGALSAMRFDAMAKGTSNADLREWCRLHGISAAAFDENRPSTPDALKAQRQTRLSPALVFMQKIADRRRRQREKEREKQAADPFNAMGADATEVRARLARLGIDDPAVEFRRHAKKELKPLLPQERVFSMSQVEAQARAAKPTDVQPVPVGRNPVSETSWPVTR